MCRCGSGGNDLEGEVGVHRGVQLDGGGVVADALHGLGEGDGPLVDGGASGLLDGLGQLSDGDGPEQRTGLGDPSANLDGKVLDLGADLLRVLNAADLAGVAGTLDAFDLFLGTAGPDDGLALRDEVVAAVAVADLDDVPGDAELVDGAGQNELHQGSSDQRAVEA